MANRPHGVEFSTGQPWEPKVIDGGGNGGGRVYTQIGQTSGGGGKGGETLADIAGLKKNVGFLNWAVGFMFICGISAIIGSYLMLAADIRDLSSKSAAQNATLDGVESSLERIERKLDSSQSESRNPD